MTAPHSAEGAGKGDDNLRQLQGRRDALWCGGQDGRHQGPVV